MTEDAQLTAVATESTPHVDVSDTASQVAGVPRPVPTGTKLLKHIGCLATMTVGVGDIFDASVFIKGNVIAWVGTTAGLPEEYQTADEVLELPEHVIIPGLVNTHHHMYQVLTRVIAQDTELFGWLTSLYPLWEKFTGEDAYISAKLAMVELLASGCTTSSDHLYVFPNDVTVDHTIRAARETGMRFHPTRGCMSRGKSLGGLAPDSIVESEPEILKDMTRLIEQYHDPQPYSMLRMGLAPCSIFTITNDLLIASAKLARQYEKVRLHAHLSENDEDIAYMSRQNMTAASLIQSVGWDKDDCWFAHCVKLTDEEVGLFSRNQIGICHCPASNTRLASGILPLRKMIDAGCNVGLGVDGSASNDAGNLLSEVRLSLLLQRAHGNVRGLTVREALKVGVQGGAKNLGRDDVGEIAPGFAADLVGWRTDTPAFVGAMQDPVAALVLCSPSIGSVDLSIINGDFIIKEGEFTEVDVKALVKQARACAARICADLKEP